MPTPTPLPLALTPPPTYNHTPSNISALLTSLPSITHSLLPAALTAASSTPHSPAPPSQTPKAILHPRTTQHVSAILAACHEQRIAVTAVAGGTSLGGALAATRAGICVDFAGMSEVLDVHEEDGDVVVQPGVGWVELNERLARVGGGWRVPVDPAVGARVGGMIAMSCSGTNAYRHGTMRNWVISLTAVLADGSIVKTRNRPRKSSAGYDLAQLLIGSEGTLGLVTEAVLKLAPLPRNLHVSIVTFTRLQQGVDTAVKMLRSGEVLEALELADAECMRAINRSGLAAQRFEEVPTLFAKMAGAKTVVTEQWDLLQNLSHESGATKFEVSSNKARIDEIWGARKCLGHALVAMKKDPSDLFLHTDAAVPISKMARLVEESERIIKEGGGDWFCASVGHVGDGNVHTAIVCPASAREKAEFLLAQIQRLALQLEGTITGEHGIGLKLRDLLVEEVGQTGVDVMRRIKMSLDPRGILNPDKVVRLEEGW